MFLFLFLHHVPEQPLTLNNLQLLSEEIFDFSRGEMTQQKIKELKSSLNRLDSLPSTILVCLTASI